MGDCTGGSVELTVVSGLNLTVKYSDIGTAVWSGLFMNKSQGMGYFMNGCTFLEKLHILQAYNGYWFACPRTKLKNYISNRIIYPHNIGSILD